jgi:hypothetical protein
MSRVRQENAMSNPIDRRAALLAAAGITLPTYESRSLAKADSPATGGLFRVRGRGAVPRSTHDKLQDWVSITDFGASETNPDNKIFLERAAAAAMSSGRSLAIPAGTFNFSQIDLRRNDEVSPTRLVLSGPGTLRSTYRGTAITASQGPFYDLVVDGIRFESVAGKGTKLFDGDAFLRLIITPGTQISEFDWAIYGTQYLQSVRMIGAIIRGGYGAVVKAPMAYDCQFTHNIIEFVTDGIVIDGNNDPAVHTCAIENNIIEGIGGTAVILGTCLATKISGNYMEGNRGGDIRLDAGSSPHKGLMVQANSIQTTPERIEAHEYGITWGASTALPVKAGNNFCTGPLHNTTGTTGLIDMSGDYSPVELYKGYALENTVGRAPTGRTIYNDGLAQHVAWFDRYLTLDPWRNEVRFGGSSKSTVSGQLEPPVLTFGEGSPEKDAGNYDRKTWARGSVVFNANAARGEPAGWICIRAGEPGKWASLRLE